MDGVADWFADGRLIVSELLETNILIFNSQMNNPNRIEDSADHLTSMKMYFKEELFWLVKRSSC